MLVSGRVRQRQSSSAAEFGLKSRRTKKEMEVRRRLLRQVRSDVSGTNVTRRFLVPRAGARRCCCQPLPEEMLCRSRCIVSRAQHSEMVSYGVGRDRCRNTSGVGDGRGLLYTSTRSRWYESSGCGARRSPRARESTSDADGGSRSSASPPDRVTLAELSYSKGGGPLTLRGDLLLAVPYMVAQLRLVITTSYDRESCVT